MKKRKKIIRVRRNPRTHEMDELEAALIHGNFEYLTYLRISHFQGSWCDDCDQEFYFCECEKCDDCNQKRCLCLLNDLEIDDKFLANRNKIRKIVWQLVRYQNWPYW